MPRETPFSVRVRHAVPGRCRLAVAGGDAARLEALAVRLRRDARVREVSVRPLTGSLVVRHDPAVTAEALAATAGRAAGGGHRTLAAQAARPAATSAPAAEAGPRSRRGSGGAGPWHVMEAGDVIRALRSDAASGLAPDEAARRLADHGPNRLARARPRAPLAIFLSQFANLPTLLLGGSASVSLATGGVADAVVTLAVVLANGTIGFVTEGRAETTLRAFAAPAEHEVAVRRGGAILTLAAAEVVPGDILVLTPGSFVAADGRVFAAEALSVDEAILTGESLPVLKGPEALAEAACALGDRRNMVFMGTAVSGGSGEAVAVATGAKTEIGRIQALAGAADRPATPVEQELERLGRRLVLIAGGVCAAMIGIGMVRGYPGLTMVRSAIALAVAAVPEGLPTVATTTLALGLRAMERRGVLIRRLDAVEALGALQTVCFDKTGTLTENAMSVQAVFVNGTMRMADTIDDAADTQALRGLLETAVLCNEAHHGPGADGADHMVGSATEAALLLFAERHGLAVDALRAATPCRHVIYRDGTRKRMTTVHGCGPDTHLAVKGNPEEVLALCTLQSTGAGVSPLSELDRQLIRDANADMAGEGLRVLGFASRSVPAGASPEEEDLVWHGLAGLADPIRPGLKPLLGRFHRAGIRTVMITGDQGGTAAAVARHLGLSGDGPPRIATASDIEALDLDALSRLVPDIDVFARVSPAHKLKIVQAFQRAGQVVAMTGDGINDGPALKAADIGIAMGRSGADAAKDVANVVLADDRLDTLAEAIAQGRSIFTNIRKALRFLLATNLSEIGVMLAEALHGPNELETPLELLWVNLVTDVLPSLGLGMLPPDDDVMGAPPRGAGASIFGREDFARVTLDGALIAVPVTAAHLAALARYGPGPQTRAVTFSSLVFAQLAYAFACRHDFGARTRLAVFGAPPLNRAVAGALALQALPLLLPPLQRLLGIAPLRLADLPLVAGAGLTPFAIAEYWRSPKPQR